MKLGQTVYYFRPMKSNCTQNRVKTPAVVVHTTPKGLHFIVRYELDGKTIDQRAHRDWLEPRANG